MEFRVDASGAVVVYFHGIPFASTPSSLVILQGFHGVVGYGLFVFTEMVDEREDEGTYFADDDQPVEESRQCRRLFSFQGNSFLWFAIRGSLEHACNCLKSHSAIGRTSALPKAL